jgi:peptidoglycan/LPS O-acetylase OafA/YrhL
MDTPSSTASVEPKLCRDTRENNLPMLRMLLALAVVVTHAHVVLKGEVWGEDPLAVLTNDQITAGTAAVAGFFILSGYLVTQSWDLGRGFLDYMRKRLVRIYPGYLVAAGLGFLVIGPLGTAGAGAPLGEWGRYFGEVDWGQALLQWVTLGEPYLGNTFVTEPIAGCINASLWSIRHEFACYLLVPLLGATGLLASRAGLLRLFAGVYGLYAAQEFLKWQVIPTGVLGGWFNEGMLLMLLSNFLAGVVVYRWRDRILRSRTLFLGCVALLLGAMQWWRGFGWLMPTVGAYLLFYVAFSRSVSTHALYERWIKDDLSYGLYLYHWPVQMLLVRFLAPWLDFWSLFGASLVFSLVLARLSWRWIESPALRWKKSTRSGGGDASGTATWRLPALAKAGAGQLANAFDGARR